MYIGKHRNMPVDDEKEGVHNIQIPQNYAGNAFSSIRDDTSEKSDKAEEACESSARLLPACIDAPKERIGLFANIDRLFSSDTLLILLAILLAGSDEGGELAVILLLLLLF